MFIICLSARSELRNREKEEKQTFLEYKKQQDNGFRYKKYFH